MAMLVPIGTVAPGSSVDDGHGVVEHRETTTIVRFLSGAVYPVSSLTLVEAQPADISTINGVTDMNTEMMKLTPENYAPGSWMVGATKIYRVVQWEGQKSVYFDVWDTTDPQAVDPEKPDTKNMLVAAPGVETTPLAAKAVGTAAKSAGEDQRLDEIGPFLEQLEAGLVAEGITVDALVGQCPVFAELDQTAAVNRAEGMLKTLKRQGRALYAKDGELWFPPTAPPTDAEAEVTAPDPPVPVVQPLDPLDVPGVDSLPLPNNALWGRIEKAAGLYGLFGVTRDLCCEAFNGPWLMKDELSADEQLSAAAALVLNVVVGSGIRGARRAQILRVIADIESVTVPKR